MANVENLTPFTKDDDRASEAGRKGGANKKGTKHLSTHIQEMLNDPEFELKLKTGEILKGRPLEAIIKTAIAKGVSGQVQWAEWLAKHGYGEKLHIELEDPRKIILAKYMGEGDVGETEETESGSPKDPA